VGVIIVKCDKVTIMVTNQDGRNAPQGDGSSPNNGLKNKRPIPETLRGTERTEVPPSPARTLGAERRQQNMDFWLSLTPELRATYMSMAVHPGSETEILRRAVRFAKKAEMPTWRDF